MLLVVLYQNKSPFFYEILKSAYPPHQLFPLCNVLFTSVSILPFGGLHVKSTHQSRLSILNDACLWQQGISVEHLLSIIY